MRHRKTPPTKEHLALCREWANHRLHDLSRERRESEALSMCGLLDGAWRRAMIATEERFGSYRPRKN